jgi:perosamine synthetase
MYGVVLDHGGEAPARVIADRLKADGIETRPFFVGMHAQPVLRRLGLFEGESYPVTDHLATAGLYLPSSPSLTESKIDQITSALARALAA